MRFPILGAACAALSLGLTGSAAFASATVNSASPVAAGGGNFQFPYSISISSGDKISTGNFFRVYDFNNLIAGSIVAPTGWSVSTALSNPTPPPNILLSFADDPASPNLIFTYTGAPDIAGATSISGFSALAPTAAFEFTDGVARVTGVATGGNVDSGGTVIAPVVPEPTTAALLALASGALLARRRAR